MNSVLCFVVLKSLVTLYKLENFTIKTQDEILDDEDLNQVVSFSDFNDTRIGLEMLPNIMNFEQDQQLYQNDCELIEKLTSTIVYKYKIDKFGTLETIGGDMDIDLSDIDLVRDIQGKNKHTLYEDTGNKN